MLLIPEGQTREAWEPSKKAMLFQKLESVGYNSTFTFFFQVVKKTSQPITNYTLALVLPQCASLAAKRY